MEYTTIIEPVMEVTLAGTAEDSLWQDLFRKEEMTARNPDGQVEILLSAVDSKFKGIQFQELSISVQVGENRYFLAHAYNSIGLFALAERKFFQTPYYPGKITVDPRRITLHDGSKPLFEATLPASASLIAEQPECHELLIHLPKNLRQSPNQPHFFHARLEGNTTIYSGQTASLNIVAHQSIWELLKASNFRLQEWRVRPAARHSKSKTYHGATNRF
jgi:hypothetical protein